MLCLTGAYVALEAGPGFDFGSLTTGELVTPSVEKGNHGFFPSNPEMLATFLAVGPNIKQSATIDIVNLIDVAPTCAYVLGLDLPNAEGKVIEDIFDSSRPQRRIHAHARRNFVSFV